MYFLEFKLSGLPSLTNQILGRHWRTKAKHANTWKRKVWQATWHLKPPAPLQRAKVTITRHSTVCPDFDGMAGAGKTLLDGLVETGILVDDSMKIIGQPQYLWEFAKKNCGHVSIRVEELESNLEFAIK